MLISFVYPFFFYLAQCVHACILMNLNKSKRSKNIHERKRQREKKTKEIVMKLDLDHDLEKIWFFFLFILVDFNFAVGASWLELKWDKLMHDIRHYDIEFIHFIPNWISEESLAIDFICEELYSLHKHVGECNRYDRS